MRGIRKQGQIAVKFASLALTVVVMTACTRSYDYPERVAREGEVYRADAPVSDRLQTRIGTRIVLPEGISPIQLDSGSLESIRDVLATATTAAYGQKSLNRLKNQLVEADRRRLEREPDWRELSDADSSRLAAFQELWRSKYNEEFNYKYEDQALNTRELIVTEGRVTAPQVLAQWPINPVPDFEVARTQPSEMPVRLGLANLQEGRRVAVAIMPATETGPETRISLIREFPVLWKIDIPDDMDAADLRENLDRLVDETIGDSGNWPENVNEAYRALTKRTMLALYGVDADYFR